MNKCLIGILSGAFIMGSAVAQEKYSVGVDLNKSATQNLPLSPITGVKTQNSQYNNIGEESRNIFLEMDKARNDQIKKGQKTTDNPVNGSSDATKMYAQMYDQIITSKNCKYVIFTDIANGQFTCSMSPPPEENNCMEGSFCDPNAYFNNF